MLKQGSVAVEWRPTRGRRQFSKLLCAATLFLLFAGAMVTSTGSGLAVPDWPLSYGMLFPPMVGGIFYEHGHRMIASTVGFLTLVFVIWLQYREPRRWVRRLGWTALFAVVLQGALGGLTVLFLLPPQISISHALLAQTFFLLTVTLAYVQSEEWARRQQDPLSYTSPFSWKWVLALVALTYVQLFFGALMRHTGSGLAIPDFPKSGGQWWPLFDDAMLTHVNRWRFFQNLDPVTTTQMIVHFIHRGFAFIVGVAVFLVTALARRHRAYCDPLVLRSLYTACGWVCLQIFLGIITVWSARSPLLTSLHVAVGAGFLGWLFLTLLRTFPFSIATYSSKSSGISNPRG